MVENNIVIPARIGHIVRCWRYPAFRQDVIIKNGYDEALLSLESLHHRLRGVDEKAVGIWLMCHAMNLTGRDFDEFKIELESAQKDNVELKYEVTDIEPYLQKLDPTKFSETQIKKAWIIQGLILKLTTPTSRR